MVFLQIDCSIDVRRELWGFESARLRAFAYATKWAIGAVLPQRRWRRHHVLLTSGHGFVRLKGTHSRSGVGRVWCPPAVAVHR